MTLSIPHIFEAGTRVLSSHINENFTAIKNYIEGKVTNDIGSKLSKTGDEMAGALKLSSNPYVIDSELIDPDSTLDSGDEFYRVTLDDTANVFNVNATGRIEEITGWIKGVAIIKWQNETPQQLVYNETKLKTPTGFSHFVQKGDTSIIEFNSNGCAEIQYTAKEVKAEDTSDIKKQCVNAFDGQITTTKDMFLVSGTLEDNKIRAGLEFNVVKGRQKHLYKLMEDVEICTYNQYDDPEALEADKTFYVAIEVKPEAANKKELTATDIEVHLLSNPQVWGEMETTDISLSSIGTAISSGYTGGYPDSNAFDGNTGTIFVSDTTTGAYIGKHYSTPQSINQIDYYTYGTNPADRTPSSVTVKYSDDGVSWSSEGVYTLSTVANAKNSLKLSSTITANYIALFSNETTVSNWHTTRIDFLYADVKHYPSRYEIYTENGEIKDKFNNPIEATDVTVNGDVMEFNGTSSIMFLPFDFYSSRWFFEIEFSYKENCWLFSSVDNSFAFRVDGNSQLAFYAQNSSTWDIANDVKGTQILQPNQKIHFKTRIYGK